MNFGAIIMLFIIVVASRTPTTIKAVELPEQQNSNIEIKKPVSTTLKININKEVFRCIIGGTITNYPKIHRIMFCASKKTKDDGTTFFITYHGGYNKESNSFLLEKGRDFEIIRGRLRFLNASPSQIVWMQLS